MARKGKTAQGMEPSGAQEAENTMNEAENMVSEAVNDDTTRRLRKDFAVLRCPGFKGSLGSESKNCKLIMVNSKSIPCVAGKCREGGKFSVTPLHMVRAHSTGFRKVPYAGVAEGEKYKPPPNAKTVSEIVSPTSMKMWSYQTEGKDCGPRREDLNWILNSGDSFLLYVSSKSFGRNQPTGDRSLFPPDVEEIPAMSVLEVSVSPKGSDACETRHSGVRVITVRLWTHSLYSYLPELSTLPSTLELARMKAVERAQESSWISKDIESQQVCFYHKVVSPKAFINNDDSGSTGFVRLVDWLEGEDSWIDIPMQELFQYTNTVDMRSAIAMLDVAIASKALSVFVTQCDYFAKDDITSQYRGLPLVQVPDLLQNCQTMEDSGKGFHTFNTGNTFGDEDQPLVVEVLDHPQTKEGMKRHLHDFPLVGVGVATEKAYRVMFHTMTTEKAEGVQGICGFYLSLDAPKTTGAGARTFTRKRTVSMMDMMD